jgi:hypothetical protein
MIIVTDRCRGVNAIASVFDRTHPQQGEAIASKMGEIGHSKDAVVIHFDEDKSMSPHLKRLPGSIAEILASTSDTGYMTQADRYGLLAATLDDSLEAEEREAIDRLLRAIRRGKIKIV